ncbi:MAG: hypothetical protein ABJD11_11445 [Gemmatimonadota bacterium]
MAKPRSFPKEPGSHRIALEEAAELTRRFRRRNPRSVRAWLFSRDIFDDILTQKGCVGVRCYRAITPGGEPQLVLVGVDANGDDLVPRLRPDPSGSWKTTGGKPLSTARAALKSSTAQSNSQGGVVGDVGWPCPPVCATKSPLNS